MKVKLPPENLISLQAFVQLIGDALCPKIEELEGLFCVMRKRVPSPNADTSFRVPLDPKDREVLTDLLISLPHLNGRMSEQQIADFMKAYRALPNRPLWEPVVIDDEFRSINRNERLDVKISHKRKIEELISAGKIRSMDANHVPLKRLGFDTHIPREDAISYLNQYNLSLVDELHSKLFHDKVGNVNGHNSPIDALKISSGNSISHNLLNSSASGELADKATTETRKLKQRRSDLLKKAIKNALEEGGKDFTHQDVWSVFLEKATAKAPPFEKVVGGIIYWKNHEGRSVPLSMGSLRSRVDRMKKALASAP